MGIKNKAKSWLAEGLITKEQMEAICRYEKGSRPGLATSLYGFLLVAVFSASLGLIALISANWSSIPAGLKLTVYFALLGGLGLYGLKLKGLKAKSFDFWFEALLAFLMILSVAGIGLIAQIYHIRGESYNTLFFWSFITSGLVFISRGSFPFYIWFGSLYTATALYTVEVVQNDHILLKLVLLQPLLFIFLFLMCHNPKCVRVFPSLRIKRQVFGEVALLTGLLSLVVFHTVPRDIQIVKWDVFVLGALCFLFLVALYFSGFRKVQKHFLTGLLSLFVLFYFMALSLHLDKLHLMIFSVLFLGLGACFFASLGKKQLFTFFVFALLLRILFFYIALFKSLTVTGLVLLLFSLVLFVVIKWLIPKYAPRVGGGQS